MARTRMLSILDGLQLVGSCWWTPAPEVSMKCSFLIRLFELWFCLSLSLSTPVFWVQYYDCLIRYMQRASTGLDERLRDIKHLLWFQLVAGYLPTRKGTYPAPSQLPILLRLYQACNYHGI